MSDIEGKKLTMCSSPQDWSALGKNVQWAIIHDLANDHQDGIAAAANLLGLTLPEVIDFVNLYIEEKVLWEKEEKDADQDDTAHPSSTLFQYDGEQDEIVQPVPEAEADQIMQRVEADRRQIAAGATQMTYDAGIDPQSLEGVCEIWHEPETELFLETDSKVAAEKRTVQPGIEKPADQPEVQADEEQGLLGGMPPLKELVTDSFSREDITSGRSFLAFIGLQEYANRFGEWFGTGTSFREIPGIFDENNELIFSTEDTKKALYRDNALNWEGTVPQHIEVPAQREWLMEALPQDPSRHKPQMDSQLQQAQALAERVNGHPSQFYDKDRRFLDHIPEGEYGGIRYDENAQIGVLAGILANDGKEPESLVQKEIGPGVRAGSVLAQRIDDKSHETHQNFVPQGTLGDFGDDGARLFNTSSAMQNCPYMPRFDNGIARRFLELGHVDIDEGFSRRKSIPPSHPMPFPQLPPFLQPHEDIVQVAGKALPVPASLGHNNSQVTGSYQTSQAQTTGISIATPSPTIARSDKTSSNHEARNMAENNIQDAVVTVGPASGDAVPNAAQSDAQGTADSGRFSKNGIDINTFPKCFGCFSVRSRCNGGRPCSACVTRNRKCRDVTKADLDKFADKADRVMKGKAKADAKADAKAPHTEEQGMVRAAASTSMTAVPAPAVSTTTTVGVKRKQSAIAGDASTGEDDSDFDHFPPEKEDPKDSDYDSTPKKKRPKKSNASASKKKTAIKGAPATSTPTKRGPRGPYRKKTEKSTPKSNESGSRATGTPTPQPSGSALAGSAAAVTSAQKKPAKIPAAMQDKSSGLSRNAGGCSLLGAGAAPAVHNSAEAVRHAGDKFGMTNVRPVPAGKRGETHAVLNPSMFSPKPPGFEDARYIDIPFAPVVPQTHSPAHGFAPPMTPVPRTIAGLPGAAFRASPSQGAYAMPDARSHVIPPRPQTIPAENDHLSGAELASAASSLNARMAVHEKLPVTTERMSLVPQSARPSFSGSTGATDISPTSQSSGSGSTVSMDFLRMPFSPAQGSPAYSYGGMSGRLPRSSPDYHGMSGFSPNFSAGMVSLGSPAAPQRQLSVSPHNNRAHGSVSSVSSPMIAAYPGSAAAPGLMSPYAMFPQQRPIPRPISRLQEARGYPAPQQPVQSSRPSDVFRDHQSEGVRSGSRGVSASPSHQQHTSSPRGAKRLVDTSLDFGQQPARKKPRPSDSPLAPPREASSWKELARTQWATETQENQPETPKYSVKPVFGGDASYEVSFSQFTRIDEQIDPELQQTAMSEARKINHSSTGTSEKH